MVRSDVIENGFRACIAWEGLAGTVSQLCQITSINWDVGWLGLRRRLIEELRNRKLSNSVRFRKPSPEIGFTIHSSPPAPFYPPDERVIRRFSFTRVHRTPRLKVRREIWFPARKLIRAAIDLSRATEHRFSFVLFFATLPFLRFSRVLFVVPRARGNSSTFHPRRRWRASNRFVYISRNRFAAASEYFSRIPEHFACHLFRVYFARLLATVSAWKNAKHPRDRRRKNERYSSTGVTRGNVYGGGNPYYPLQFPIRSFDRRIFLSGLIFNPFEPTSPFKI